MWYNIIIDDESWRVRLISWKNRNIARITMDRDNFAPQHHHRDNARFRRPKKRTTTTSHVIHSLESNTLFSPRFYSFTLPISSALRSRTHFTPRESIIHASNTCKTVSDVIQTHSRFFFSIPQRVPRFPHNIIIITIYAVYIQ